MSRFSRKASKRDWRENLSERNWREFVCFLGQLFLKKSLGQLNKMIDLEIIKCMKFEFDRIVESILNEISQPEPPRGDSAWKSNKPSNPQAGYGDPSAGVRRQERNYGEVQSTPGELVFFTKGQRNSVWKTACDAVGKGKFKISDNWIKVKSGSGKTIFAALEKAGVNGLEGPTRG